MKTFVKKNLIWVFALLVGIGTMSFKLVEKSMGTYQWYEVDEDGISILQGSPLGGEPTGEDCNRDNTETVCAIGFELQPGKPFPLTVSDAYADHDVEGTTQRDE